MMLPEDRILLTKISQLRGVDVFLCEFLKHELTPTGCVQ